MRILRGFVPCHPLTHRKGSGDGTGKLLECFPVFGAAAIGAGKFPKVYLKVRNENKSVFHVVDAVQALPGPTLHFSSALLPLGPISLRGLGAFQHAEFPGRAEVGLQEQNKLLFMGPGWKRRVRALFPPRLAGTGAFLGCF